MNLKTKILLLFVQAYQIKKEVPYMEKTRDSEQKGKNILIWKCHVRMTKKDAYISNEIQFQNNSQFFIHKNKSLFSATSILYRSPLQHYAYNTTGSQHGLQHYCFLGRANLYRLCGLWQMSRQIWTTFLDQK